MKAASYVRLIGAVCHKVNRKYVACELCWYRFKKDVELVTGGNISVETVEKAQEVTSTLFVDNCAVSDDAEVKVVAENKAGTASHTAKLTVLGK